MVFSVHTNISHMHAMSQSHGVKHELYTFLSHCDLNFHDL